MGNQNSTTHSEKKIQHTFLQDDIMDRLTHCMAHDTFKDCFRIVRGLIQYNPNVGKIHKDLFCDCFKKYVVENDIQVDLVIIDNKAKRIASIILYNYWLMKIGVVQESAYVEILRRASTNKIKKHIFDVLKYLKDQSFSSVYIGIPALCDFFKTEHFDAIFNDRAFISKLYKFQLLFNKSDGRFFMRNKEDTYNFYLSAGFVIIDQYKKHIRETNGDEVAAILGSTLLALNQSCEYSEGDSITISKKSIISIMENKTISKYLESL